MRPADDVPRSGGPRPGGHRGVPHTADLRVEAWGPTREVCLAQAVRGACESFVDLAAAARTRRDEVVVRAETDEDLLVALLDEVVYRLDARGEVPVEVEVAAVPGGVRAVLELADLAALPVTGAAPKAVTLHGLVCGRGPGGWRCSVILDV
ncbi:archease [Streptomyces sp. RS10V-4]|uniref:archease n=1 Tax=Streptomyces rhizoryzae TaxID=2932493 RepID=UPI00200388A1|nr:archease [Streptomyces rhizoryzae]MCK7622218.1 archease [Streptomyces rhizoryzae]